MTTPDVNVILIDFPAPGREMVVSNEDGTYTILINARLSHASQLKAYEHALQHIYNKDFEKSDIQSIEFQAHELKAPEKDIPAQTVLDNNEKRIRQLQRKRKKIQKALKEKEKEIKLITDLYGPDYFFEVAEYKWLYGESE